MRETICHVEPLHVNVYTWLEIQHLLLDFCYRTRWLSDSIFKPKEVSSNFRVVESPVNVQCDTSLRYSSVCIHTPKILHDAAPTNTSFFAMNLNL